MTTLAPTLPPCSLRWQPDTMNRPTPRQLTWLAALVVSLALHLLIVADLKPFSFAPSTPPAPDVRPLSVELYAQQVEAPVAATPAQAAPPAPPAIALPEAGPAKPAKKVRPKPAPVEPARTEPAPAASGESGDTPPADTAPAAAAESAAPPPAPAEDDEAALAALAAQNAKRFPQHATLVYEVYYGNFLAGLGDFDWQLDGSHYRIDVLLRPIIGPRLHYQSLGSVTATGLRPDEFIAERGGKRRESARFDWGSKTLTYGNEGDKTAPLETGAQDIISVAFQIALKGGATLDKPVQITTGKKVYTYPVVTVGDSDVMVGDTRVPAVLARSQGDGDTTEFWLAPQYNNLPIRIRRRDEDKVLDQRLIKLVIGNETKLEKPAREQPSGN